MTPPNSNFEAQAREIVLDLVSGSYLREGDMIHPLGYTESPLLNQALAALSKLHESEVARAMLRQRAYDERLVLDIVGEEEVMPDYIENPSYDQIKDQAYKLGVNETRRLIRQKVNEL